MISRTFFRFRHKKFLPCSLSNDPCPITRSGKFPSGNSIRIGFVKFNTTVPIVSQSSHFFGVQCTLQTIDSKFFLNFKQLQLLTAEFRSQVQQITSKTFTERNLPWIIIRASVRLHYGKCFESCNSLKYVAFESDSKLDSIDPGGISIFRTSKCPSSCVCQFFRKFPFFQERIVVFANLWMWLVSAADCRVGILVEWIGKSNSSILRSSEWKTAFQIPPFIETAKVYSGPRLQIIESFYSPERCRWNFHFQIRFILSVVLPSSTVISHPVHLFHDPLRSILTIPYLKTYLGGNWFDVSGISKRSKCPPQFELSAHNALCHPTHSNT
jgi:hypothetical protein